MATPSAVTNSFSTPGALMAENFADILNVQFKDVALRVWSQPVEGMKYWSQETSTRASEKYSAVATGDVIPRSRDVDEYPRASAIQGFDVTITPNVYRMAMFVERRLRETDQFAVINKMFNGLNQSAKDTIELYAALPFNTTYAATADWLCGDGMLLVDKSRPYETPSLGTWDNDETVGALTQARIATMRTNFAKNKNERGFLRPLRMQKVVVPPDLEDTAITHLKSVLKPESSLNSTNYLTQYGLSYEVWNYLTSATAWFGFTAMDSLYELKWVWGASPKIDVQDVESGNVDVFGKRVRMVFQTGCLRPHSVRGNAGA